MFVTLVRIMQKCCLSLCMTLCRESSALLGRAWESGSAGGGTTGGGEGAGLLRGMDRGAAAPAESMCALRKSLLTACSVLGAAS